jgi:hypothetical protein
MRLDSDRKWMCVIYKNQICQYVNTTDRIIIDPYIAI